MTARYCNRGGGGGLKYINLHTIDCEVQELSTSQTDESMENVDETLADQNNEKPHVRLWSA